MSDKTRTIKKQTTRNLTTGSPIKLILAFAGPMFLGLLFQQFYSMVDTMIVGKYLGEDPFAGVGSTGSLSFLVIGFISGLCNGFAVPIAQKFGANDYEGLRRMVYNCILLSGAFAVIITTIVVVFCKPVLRLMDTPDDIFKYAYIYIVIVFAGIPFTILYNMASALLRSLGDSKSPVVFLIISSFINIGLDYLLIVVCGMNVEGAAIATIISQAVSGIVSVVYIIRNFDILKMRRSNRVISAEDMKKLSFIGIPMGLQYSITAIGTIVIQSAVNGLGSLYVAGITAGSKLNMFLSCVMEALGQTMAPFAGQNVGACRYDRVSKGMKQTILVGFASSAVLLIIVLVWGRDLAMLFLEERIDEVIDYSYQFLIASVSCYSLLVLVNVVRFTIQGMGFSSFAMIAGVLEMIARSLAGIVLVPIIGYTGICLANPLAWIFADAFLIPAYVYCMRKMNRIYNYP